MSVVDGSVVAGVGDDLAASAETGTRKSPIFRFLFRLITLISSGARQRWVEM